MASKEPPVHRLGLGRIVVEGNRQPIVRVATLTLKDEDPDKHIMQVHVDGSTLAQWDLGKLSERKSTGGEQFFSISEQRMLHFTLPLSEEGQTIARGTELKTIQLFLLTPQDFHTAVDYLSQNAGLRHCHLKNVSANLIDANAPQHAQSQPQDSPRTSIMEPPMRPPTRPRSQSSVFAPAAQSAAQFDPRPQTARPYSTLVNGGPTQRPLEPRTAVPIRGWYPPQGHRNRSSLPQHPQDPQGFFAPDGSSQHQQFPSRSCGVGGVGNMIALYDHHPRRASMASYASSSHPMQHIGRELLPSHQQAQTDTHRVLDGVYHDRFDGPSVSGTDRFMSSASRSLSTRPSLFQNHSSSRPAPGELASRSLSVLELGVPIKIQVLGPPDEPSHSYSRAKIRWEFTLHLLPSTRIFELCLHAASYIRREYLFAMDGQALAAKSRDGTVYGDRDSLSQRTLQGEPLVLIERRLLSTIQAVPTNLSGSYPDSLHPGWRSEAGKLDGLRPASSEDSSSCVIDENDQVPPPRQLPFPLVAAAGPPRSSSSTVAAQSPLSERPDLRNSSIRTPASHKLGQPIRQSINSKAGTKKPPSSHKSRHPPASRKSTSSPTGSNLDPVSATTQPSEPRAPTTRPETSLGIRSKRKAPSTDAGVSVAMLPVQDSIPSGAGSRKSEQATAACMGCRNKKRKCDRAKPACGPCVKDARPCTYPNIREKAVTDSTANKECKGQGTEAGTHPMALRSQAVTSHPPMSDALTQTTHAWESRDIGMQTSLSWESRDIGMQTQLIEQRKQDAEMKDVGTDSRNLYTDALVETDRCDEIWLPLSQAAEVMLWANKRYDEAVEKAADIFQTTDPSQEDYRRKLEQAATHAIEFEYELRDKCEKILRR